MEIVMVAMSGKVSASHCMSSVTLGGSHKRSFDPLFAFPLTSGRSTFPRLLFLIGNCSNGWARLDCSGIIMVLRTGGKLRLRCLAQQ